MELNRYKKIPYSDLEHMRNKLFHTIYMNQIFKLTLTDEGWNQLEMEAMGPTASILSSMAR